MKYGYDCQMFGCRTRSRTKGEHVRHMLYGHGITITEEQMEWLENYPSFSNIKARAGHLGGKATAANRVANTAGTSTEEGE